MGFGGSNLHSTHQRISGESTGKTSTFKKEGYAGLGPLPTAVQQTKPGKTPQVGYSGPPVAMEGSKGS